MDSVTKRRQFERASRLQVPLRVDFLTQYPGVDCPADPGNSPLRRVYLSSPTGRRDTRLEDEGVRETLNFDGQWVECFVPWDAIFWISTDAGVCYVDETESRLDVKDALAELFPRPRSRPVLTVVKGGYTMEPENHGATVIPMLRVVR